MNSLIHLYVFAGLAFAFAVINIITGLQKKSDRTYLFFGLISFCIGIYYVLFPLAYHSNHPEFYDRTGLAFFIVAFGLFPWFFLYYGQCKRNNIPWILSGGMAFTFLLFIFDIEGGIGRLWNIVGHIFLIGIALYGFHAAIFIRKSGRLRSANILLLAMVIFSLLMVDDIIYVHFHSYYLFDLPQGILPFDYFFILFMIIMGSKLAGDLKQKAYLEGKNVHQQKRWQKLLEEVDLIVVELSDTGLVRYVNPYYLKLTGFNKEHVIGKNWFLEFLPEKSGREVYKVFEQNLKTDKHPNYRNTIVNSNGEEHLVAWSNVILYDDNGNPSGSISIGSDITKEEKAFQEVEELKSKLELENIILKSELYQLADQGTIIGKSDAIKYVVQRAGQVAETDTSVLLEGETGVGKEIFANYIQSNSKRNSKPFVKVNCSALPAALLESELFGHVKGAFTGAERNKKGLVELADGGTLFLDEIGEVPIELQPKLLRFLQEGEFNPVGGENVKKVDIRLISATNKQLLKEIERGDFRDDLYYRISVYPITIPALRNRKEDILEFAELFIKKYSRKHGKQVSKISKSVIAQLTAYDWPGNIRELENVIERAIILSNSDTLKLKDIPIVLQNDKTQTQSDQRIKTMQAMEKEHIRQALKMANWKIHGTGGAAEILGMNPNTLRSRMKKLNITKTT